MQRDVVNASLQVAASMMMMTSSSPRRRRVAVFSRPFYLSWREFSRRSRGARKNESEKAKEEAKG